MITSKNTVLRIVAGKVSDGAKITLRAEKSIVAASYKIFDAEERCVLSGELNLNANTAEATAIFDAEAWSISNPVLYSLSVSVSYDGEESEEIRDKFGFRYFSCDEDYIYLN